MKELDERAILASVNRSLKDLNPDMGELHDQFIKSFVTRVAVTPLPTNLPSLQLIFLLFVCRMGIGPMPRLTSPIPYLVYAPNGVGQSARSRLRWMARGLFYFFRSTSLKLTIAQCVRQITKPVAVQWSLFRKSK